MNKVRVKPFTVLVLLLLSSLLVWTGCATVPSPTNEDAGETKPAAKTEEPKEEQEEEPEEEEETTEERRPEEVEEEDPEEKSGSDEWKEPQEDSVDEEPYVVTEKEYEETFSNIETLIQELNQIIKSKNYDKWLTYLAKDYREYLSDPKTLKEISQEPVLKKYDIALRSLKDYFNYVVVPSRSNARLDDLVFVDKNHVKAIMIISNKRIILYELKKIDGKWKIGNW